MSREGAVNLGLALLLLLVPVAATLAGEPWIVTLATRAAILGLAGVGLNLVLGHGGLVSFGHAAFFGLGGYAAGILASRAALRMPVMTWPVEIGGTQEMLVIWPVAMLSAGLAALAIGALSLRTSGAYFIMITLAFAQMIYYFAISWPAYGGEDGLSVPLRSRLPGIDSFDPLSFFLVAYGALLLGILVSFLIVRSRFGLALEGARQNPLRLAAVGIEPFRIRLVAFAISGMIAGLAGALYVDLNRFVSPAMLSWHLSGELIVFVILGGLARLWGPVAGAALYILLEEVLGGLTPYWQVLLGALLLVVVLAAPGGIVGLLAGRRRHG